MTFTCFRNPIFLASLTALTLILPAVSVFAQEIPTYCFECNKAIGSGDLIEPCDFPEAWGFSTQNCVLNPEQQKYIYLNLEDGNPNNDLVCSRLFWTADGRYYPAEVSEAHHILAEEGSRFTATSWYHCRTICNDPPCPGGGGLGIYALDMDSAEWITEPVVEDINPSFAVGSCAVGTPCATLSGEPVHSLSAFAIVDDLKFSIWDNFDPGDLTISATSAAGLGHPQTALYAEPEPANYCTTLEAFVGTDGCGPLIDRSLWEIVLFERGNAWDEIPDICRYVLDLEECGCVKGYCPPIDLLFDVSGLETTPEIVVIDARTGKVQAVAKEVDAQTRRMTLPMNTDLLDSGVLFFDFGPGQKMPRTGTLGVELLDKK